MSEPTGAQLRDAGVAAALDASAAVHREHVRAAVEAALEGLIASGREFSADDLWDALDADTRARAPGTLVSALFAGAVTSRRIRLAGYGCSNRPSRHRGLFRRWIRAEPDAA